MEWLLLFFYIEFGFLPEGIFQLYERNEKFISSGSFYVDLYFEAEAFGFFAGGQSKAFIYKNSHNYAFSPDNIQFDFFTGYRYNNIEIGFRHFCIHPIIPYYYFYESIVNYEGSYSELYLRIEVKNVTKHITGD